MFDGQTKDCLNSKAASFGSSCDLSDKFLKHIDQTCGVLESVYFDMEAKSRKAFISKSKPSKKHFLDIPKLDDAHRAGSKDALQCTLILTEGDSAKALAVSGLEVVGRELFGVLPLRGKVLRTMPPSLCSDAAAIVRCDDDGVDSMILSKNCIANR
jgi:DNA topoisomerase-2